MSIFRLVLNMIRITLNFYAQKKTLKSFLFSVPAASDRELYVIPPQDNYSVSQSKLSVKCFSISRDLK